MLQFLLGMAAAFVACHRYFDPKTKPGATQEKPKALPAPEKTLAGEPVDEVFEEIPAPERTVRKGPRKRQAPKEDPSLDRDAHRRAEGFQDGPEADVLETEEPLEEIDTEEPAGIESEEDEED